MQHSLLHTYGMNMSFDTINLPIFHPAGMWVFVLFQGFKTSTFSETAIILDFVKYTGKYPPVPHKLNKSL